MNDIDKQDLETIDIETPLDETSSPSPAFAAPKQKKSKKGLIITILVLVVLLAVAGFAYYWFFMKQEPATVTANGTESTAQTQTQVDDGRDYAKEIIEKVRTSEAELVADYPNSKVEDSEDYAPAYMYGSNKYYVNGQFGHAITVTDTGNLDEAFNAAGEQAAFTVLEKEELIKKQKDYLTTFINDNVICTVSHNSYPVYIACANTRDYKEPSENVKPFAEAYFKNPNAADESQVVFGQPGIEQKSDGYKNAGMSIGAYEGVGGFAGLFYWKDNTWTYWRGTQNILPCSDYNTYELQKSFEGTECYVQGQIEDSVVIVTMTK